MMLRKIIAVLLSFCLVFSAMVFTVFADPAENGSEVIELDCRSAILMEAKTGKILYEKNANEALPPASVTKVMTLLLVMEAIESGKLSFSDTVTASAHACSMGGSQIYLKEGEEMSVEDLVKSVVIASANDAALALAEHIAGTEAAFVKMMNDKAAVLGLTDTHFENTNGLDDTVQNHVSSARDIAIMSKELIRHEKILEFSSIWMDSIRNGEFGLTNTNRLVRFYKGATGLKTGSTAKAKFCITATAERGGMSLICVIMAAPTRDIRNAAATSLLDWGFANYEVYESEPVPIDPVKVLGGVETKCGVSYPKFSCVVKKSDSAQIKYSIELRDSVAAPIKAGDVLGKVTYKLRDETVGSVDITADESVEKIDFWGILVKLLSKMLFC